ncbi:MAG: hypothetical protein ACK48W_10500, partial [Bacteroidota bacterium]
MEESINLNSQSLPEENNIQVKKHTKFSDIVQFTKIRLASLVVLSAALCYLFGADEINSSSLIMLVIGGFFVTAASNGFN